MSRQTNSRREVLAGSAAAAATILTRGLSASAEGKKMSKTFTILHTNDMHSAFIGMGPASDYNPLKLNDDRTRGGFARLAWLIAQRKAAREEEGPVNVLWRSGRSRQADRLCKVRALMPGSSSPDPSNGEFASGSIPKLG